MITEFGLKTLQDRYFAPGETEPEQLLLRVSKAFSDDKNHCSRILNYMKRGWFLPASPILMNGGTGTGLPISCFLNKVPDTMEGINAKWSENSTLGSSGGGVGTDWSNVRSLGEPIGARKSPSSGIIPFIKVQDAMTVAVSQANLRKGATAAYLHISHPEIEEFIDLRKPGSPQRKASSTHNAVVVPDRFMHAVLAQEPWDLVSPVTGEKIKEVDAFNLFVKLLETRLEKGEPYILFEDTATAGQPSEHLHDLCMSITQSNLCIEIMQPTGHDCFGRDRTAVCCLGSVNALYFKDWRGDPLFLKDCLTYLDNVITYFIRHTKGIPGYEAANYSAERQRSVGIGVMGFHTYLQTNMIPFESVAAKSFNKRLFSHMKETLDKANLELGARKGACPDSNLKRCMHTMAVAPNASISIIAGECSPGVNPLKDMYFMRSTLTAVSPARCIPLSKLIESKVNSKVNAEDIWSEILKNKGSIQGLGHIFTELEQDVFKTAFEIDQRWVIELASDRASLIDQGQSIDLFLDPECSKWDLINIHILAWKKKVKSLYYLRSDSIQQVGSVGDNQTDYGECLACE